MNKGHNVNTYQPKKTQPVRWFSRGPIFFANFPQVTSKEVLPALGIPISATSFITRSSNSKRALEIRSRLGGLAGLGCGWWMKLLIAVYFTLNISSKKPQKKGWKKNIYISDDNLKSHHSFFGFEKKAKRWWWVKKIILPFFPSPCI